MLIEILKDKFDQDLTKLKSELMAYSVEKNLWKTPEGIVNSAGTLALHLAGNLKAFIGAELGGTGYVRKRKLEFSLREIPREELNKNINEVITIVQETLNKLSEEDLQKPFPIEVFRKPMTTGYFLVHLSNHLNYHLGQINYHRRMIDSQGNS